MEQGENDFINRVINLFGRLHPLDRIQRAGYVLRGVAEPESVAAHSHFVSLLTLLFTQQYPDMFNKEKALAMALMHDLPEAVLMDIPMPASIEYLQEAKQRAEDAIFHDLFAGFPVNLHSYQEEFRERSTPEAKLVAGLDKAQLMLKVLYYRKEGRGNLSEFWKNPGNFNDYGIKPVSMLFDALCRQAGCPRPVKADNRDFI